MIDLIVPADFADKISRETKKKIVFVSAHMIGYDHEYKYIFDFLINQQHRRVIASLPISRTVGSSSMIINDVADVLIKKINEEKFESIDKERSV